MIYDVPKREGQGNAHLKFLCDYVHSYLIVNFSFGKVIAFLIVAYNQNLRVDTYYLNCIISTPYPTIFVSHISRNKTTNFLRC